MTPKNPPSSGDMMDYHGLRLGLMLGREHRTPFHLGDAKRFTDSTRQNLKIIRSRDQ